MTRAWEIARAGAEKFGGKAIDFISESLKIAWAEIKKGVEKVKELTGTEKQVAWAEDIREGYLAALEDFKKLNALSKKERSISQGNSLASKRTILGFERKHKELEKERRKEFSARTAELNREEKLEIQNELRAEYENKFNNYVSEKVEETLNEADSVFWIDNFKHLSKYAK